MRLLLVIGFTYLITLMVASFMNMQYLFVIMGVAFIFFICTVFIKKIRQIAKKLPVIFATIFLASLAYMVNYHLNIKPVRNLSDMDLNVTGRIVDIPYKNEVGKYYYIFEVKNIDGMEKPKNFKVRLSSTTPIEADVYDDYICKIHVFTLENTPEFPAENYYRAKGVYLHGFLYNYEKTTTIPLEGKKPFYYYALKMRQRFISAIYSMFSQDLGAVINGIFLGEKRFIPDDITTAFDRMGIYHFLAVSGVHISIFSKLLVDILIEMGLKRRKASFVAIIVVFGFMSIAGFSSSVLRSGIMAVLYLIGNIKYKRSDSLNSLGVAILGVTLLRPDAGGDISLWLSAVSTLGIIILSPKLTEFLFSKIKTWRFYVVFLSYIIRSVSMTVAASIFTFPIICLYYKKISLISLVSNALLIFPVTVMIFCAFFVALFYIINCTEFIIMPFKLICGIAAKYIIWISRVLSSIPYALISLDYMFIRVWVIITAILIITAICFRFFTKQLKTLSLVSLSLLLVFIFIYRLVMINVIRTSVVNSGEGCTLVISKNGHNAAILYMNENTYEERIYDYMFSVNSRNLEYLIVPSYKSNNLEFLENFIDTYKPKNIAFYNNKDLGSNIEDSKEFLNLEKEFNLEFFGGIKLESRNVDEMIFSMITIENKRIMVCPYGGDANDIKNIDSSWFNCDVLVAGGLPFDYNKIKRSYTVLSMPKRDLDLVLPKVQEQNLLSTALCGTVCIDINKGQLSVRRKI